MFPDLGLEDTPDEFIRRMVVIFREVYRVLRDDGVCWLNLGDCYATAPKGGPDKGTSTIGEDHSVRQVGMFGKKGFGIKQGNLMLMPHRVAIALQDDGWVVRNDVVWSKCLSGGVKLYARTQKGDMPQTVKDLVRLDPYTVKLWNGEKWTQVLKWKETKRPKDERPLEIVLRSGERINCTAEHRWPTDRGLLETRDLRVGDIIKTTWLPEPSNPKQPKMLDDYLMGWFVGIYLAEGSRSGDKIQIASHKKEKERYEKLCEIAEGLHGSCARHVYGNKAIIQVFGKILNAIIDTYIAGHTAHDKHLSNACWERNDAFLDALLEGYLEGDGHYDEKNNRYRLGFTRNYYLEQDLRTLVARLDAQIRLKPVKVSYQDGEVDAFRGEIRLDRSDISFDRDKHPNAKYDGEIVEIRNSRGRKFWDITVADEPHLFALASGVLTHNSNPMPESVAGWRWEREKIKAGREPANWDNLPKGWDVGEGSHDAIGKGNYRNNKDRERTVAKYEYGEGYDLRRSSWRHTRAHEYVFQLCKGMQYWSNQEAVREVYTKPLDRWGGDVKTKDDEDGHIRTDLGRARDMRPNKSGRNPRSVLDVPTAPYSGAHYATFPPNLIAPLIRATCPRWACPTCGQGWAPVVEKGYIPKEKKSGSVKPYADELGLSKTSGIRTNLRPNNTVHSYRPTCSHPHTKAEAVHGIVLDPFVGSGTTVMVAHDLLRRGIGLDISMPYLDQQAKVRTGIGTPANTLEGLPLFERRTS